MLIAGGGVLTVPGNASWGTAISGPARLRARSVLANALSHSADAALYASQIEMCALATCGPGASYSKYMGIIGRAVFNVRAADSLDSHMATLFRSGAAFGAVPPNAAVVADAKAAAAAASAAASAIVSTVAIACPKCRTRDGITRIAVQRRSGDEGMTTECACPCGAKWRLG